MFKVINSNVCDNNLMYKNTEITKKNPAENDDGTFLLFINKWVRKCFKTVVKEKIINN